VTISNKISEYLDALLHPSVRCDPMISARHRVFIASRLFGSLVALASLPIYLAFRSAPSGLEAAIYVWLISPILIAYFLSRTGRYLSAHILSCVALAAMVTAVSIRTGGISSFAAVWLVALPLEAMLSVSRRIIGFACLLALACAGGLVGMEWADVLPASQMQPQNATAFALLGIVSIAVFAAVSALSAGFLMQTSSKMLLAEAERAKLLAFNAHDIVSRHHRNGAVQFISPAVESLLRVSPVHLLGQGFFDRIHVADRPIYLKALSEVAREGDVRSIEFRAYCGALRPDAGRGADFVWFEMQFRPHQLQSDLKNQDIEVVAVMRDVTERKIQEQELLAARLEAERADGAKSRFLATMSHELRTPLNAIVGFSEMIVREADLMITPERRQEYAGLINESAQHLLSLVNGILDLSKMEAGSFEISPQVFSPRDVVVSCCNLMALKAQENGIDLRAKAADDLPDIVGDPCAFRQIALNLLSNAIKFTEKGGVVTMSARVEGGRFALSVADTGVGIDSDDLGRLGNPFFRGNITDQRRYEGTGLGLSIVKRLVGLHGGEMTVASKIDEGTTVNILLPMTAVSVAPQRVSNVQLLSPPLRSDPQEIQVKKSA
jgi:cell cycle sensor histidine kinase DivJ